MGRRRFLRFHTVVDGCHQLRLAMEPTPPSHPNMWNHTEVPIHMIYTEGDTLVKGFLQGKYGETASSVSVVSKVRAQAYSRVYNTILHKYLLGYNTYTDDGQ